MCEYRSHAWVVRVGSLRSAYTAGRVERVFDSVQSFAEYCANSIDIKITAATNSNTFQVVDQEEGTINVVVDTTI